MNLDEARCRELFAAARVARLATADAAGVPHLVPIVFVVAADTVFSAVDGKPKRTQQLRRLANIAANPRVSILVDQYSEDWTALWWVRADGTARVLDPTDPDAGTARQLLRARYPQYGSGSVPVTGPVLAAEVERWSGWAAVSL
jgi:PPOX class probable F420-dependent enzyme